jgi:transcription antitermination protein NusB
MGKRSTSRRLAMQVLYQLEINPQAEALEIIDHTMSNGTFPEETREFTTALVEGVWQKKDEIDEVIANRSIGWSLDRINKVDRSILRISIYELNNSDTPTSVIINEAVNLAKKYGTDDSSKFVNGILGGLVEKEKNEKG